MIVGLYFLAAVICVFAGMVIEALFVGSHASDLEQELFTKEIECERLKERRP